VRAVYGLAEHGGIVGFAPILLAVAGPCPAEREENSRAPAVSHCRWHHARRMRLPHVLVGFTRMKCAGTPSIHGSSPAPMTGARSASVSR